VCVFAPWWVTEGLAEYVGHLPVRNGTFSIDKTLTARVVAKLVDRDLVRPPTIDRALKHSNALELDAAIARDEAMFQRVAQTLNRALLIAYEMTPPGDQEARSNEAKPSVQEPRKATRTTTDTPRSINSLYRSAHLLFFYLMYLDNDQRRSAFLRYFWRIQALSRDFGRYQVERDAFVKELESIQSQYARYKSELKSEVLANNEKWFEFPDGRFGHEGARSYSHIARRLKLPSMAPAVPPSIRSMATSEQSARQEIQAALAGRTGARLWADAVAAFDKLGIVLD
jgi:hypothetical protein